MLFYLYHAFVSCGDVYTAHDSINLSQELTQVGHSKQEKLETQERNLLQS
jgi:exonuclease III